MPTPRVLQKLPDFGLIRFNKSANQVTFECWPRDVFVLEKGAKQFTGWPLTVKLD